MRILTHLPIDSHYQAAVSQDEEIAEDMAQRQDPNASSAPPSFVGYSREVELLTYQANLLHQLIHTTIAVNSTKPPSRPKLLPTPTTALDRAMQRREKREIDDLATRFGVA